MVPHILCFFHLQYAIMDEAVSRQDIYMSCLETCSEAAAHIATLTRQKRQVEKRNRFLQKEIGIINDRIRRLEEPKQSASSQDGKYDPTWFSNNNFIHITLAAHPIHNEFL